MAATTLASAVIDSVLLRLGEIPGAPLHWTRAEILNLVWEGVVEATLITGHLQTEASVTLATSNNLQTAPSHIAILHIRIGNKVLQKYTMDELDAKNPNWAAAAMGLPSTWMPFGATQFLIYPATFISRVAVCTVLQYPPVMIESDALLIEDEYVEAIVDYAFSAARLKEGGAEWKQSLAGYERYLSRIGQLAERVAWKRAPGWVETPATLMAMAVPRQRGPV